MKDKGDKFFQNKDYLAAIQAYNQALKGDDKLLAALANRAASHMSMFNVD